MEDTWERHDTLNDEQMLNDEQQQQVPGSMMRDMFSIMLLHFLTSITGRAGVSTYHKVGHTASGTSR